MAILPPPTRNSAPMHMFENGALSGTHDQYPGGTDLTIDVGDISKHHEIDTIDLPAPQGGYELLSPHLKALGATAVSETFETSYSEYPRRHQLVRVAIPGENFHDGLWNSPVAVRSGEPLFVANLQGLGEIIEDGIARSYHERLAHELPEAIIDTHSTRGVGTTGDRMSLRELRKYGLQEMAEDKFELFCHLYGNNPLAIAATSLNSAVMMRMAKLNIDHHEPLNIQALVAYDDALTEPGHTLIKMGVLFPPALILDGAFELLLRSDRETRSSMWADLRKSKPSIHDAAPMVRQGGALFRRGTPRHITEEVAHHYKERFIEIHGEQDTLNEDHTALPITSVTVKKRGHCMVFNPVKHARSVAKALKITETYQADAA
jgi:hypothetical protein